MQKRDEVENKNQVFQKTRVLIRTNKLFNSLHVFQLPSHYHQENKNCSSV